MIVCNEEANLPACLHSVADLVHETIVVDTGSTDHTKDVARALGAQVHDFAWIDSFAAARNESLKYATGDWIFWLDADDRIDNGNRAKLASLFAGLKDENAAYVMQQRSQLQFSKRSVLVMEQVRLFRNHPQIRWQNRIHELISPAVIRLGGQPRATDIVIDHLGYRERSWRAAKHERNLRLLRILPSVLMTRTFSFILAEPISGWGGRPRPCRGCSVRCKDGIQTLQRERGYIPCWLEPFARWARVRRRWRSAGRGGFATRTTPTCCTTRA
jgi:glycosyltransferase involved in cell wall biosynthesis